jgi:MYXO-CTERM domain-containing protein
LAGLAASAVASVASAQTTPQSTVILNSATTLAYQAPNRTNPKPRQRDCSGAVDPAITFDRKTLDVFAFFTMSVPWGGTTGLDTGCQGAMAITKLTATGLATPQIIPMPLEKNAQRVRQRMNAILGTNFVGAIFADEKNAKNNGNPSTVMYVYDRTGKPLPIMNAGDVGQKPTDAVDLYALSGQDDGEQFSGHDVAQLPDEADGSQSWVVVAQYNNQKAKAFKVNITTDGVTGATVKVPWLTTLIENAQHVRPVLAVPHDGVAHNNSLIITGVDANGQPKTNGVRAVQFSTLDGHVMSSTLFKSEKTAGIYYVQPTVSYISDSVVALSFQRAQPNATKVFTTTRNNGHAAEPNLSRMMTLSVPTAEGSPFTVIQQADGVALQNRHAGSTALQYGPAGSESGGVGILSASSTGTGSGFMQVIPVDGVTGKFSEPDSLKSYQVAQYADVVGLAAATLRDPGQGRAFFKAVYGLPNPSYQNKSGFMPEVKTFSISAFAGYHNIATDNMESLSFSLVPAVWDPTVATTPGAAVPNVPPGPSPTAPSGTPVTNPSGPSAGGSTGGNQEGSGSTGSTGSTGTGGTYHPPGYGSTTSASNGCGCTTAGSNQSSNLAGFAALGLGFAFLGLRRRASSRAKKES